MIAYRFDYYEDEKDYSCEVSEEVYFSLLTVDDDAGPSVIEPDKICIQGHQEGGF